MGTRKDATANNMSIEKSLILYPRRIFAKTPCLLISLLLSLSIGGFKTSTIIAESLPPKAAIASAHPLATQAGMDILNQGGNAFDAAIAAASTLGVVEPYSAGIGGGGFWLLYIAKSKRYVFIDARETAPLAATSTMFLDAEGNFDAKKSKNGALAAAIPGQAAAFDYIAKNYGALPLHKTLASAIHFAEQGFPINPLYKKFAKSNFEHLQESADANAIFAIRENVDNLKIYQKDLAKTLLILATQGRDGFYRGEIAKKLVDDVNAHGGIWRLKDLESYQIIEREPLRFQYQNYTIITAPPPSAGGIALATMLNLLEGYPINHLDKINRTHFIVEAMRLSYRDRIKFLGDPDFVNVPTHKLISKDYANGLRPFIKIGQATPSASLYQTAITEGEETTHFSIIDKEGNRVAATLSINLSFGSGFVPKGTGVLLNNHMDDFSDSSGKPNAFGLVGGQTNAIVPGKRPLSSMTPTFVEDENSVAILGTPGGSRIITMVLLAILDHARHQPPTSWVSLPRFHHQFLPDVIQAEPSAFSSEEITQLKKFGYQFEILKQAAPYGNMQAILWDKKDQHVSAASDPRGIGAAVVVER